MSDVVAEIVRTDAGSASAPVSSSAVRRRPMMQMVAEPLSSEEAPGETMAALDHAAQVAPAAVTSTTEPVMTEAVVPAAPVRRRPMMQTVAEPLSPEASTEQIAEAPEQAIAENAPAAPVVRRRPMMQTVAEPLSPEASTEQIAETPEQAEPVMVQAAASSGVAEAINPPSAPRDADGAYIVTPEMRARAQGVDARMVADPDAVSGSSPQVDPTTASTTVPSSALPATDPATGSTAPLVDHEREDPLKIPEAVDPLHELLISSLLAIRQNKRDSVSAELDELAVKRVSAAEEVSRLLGLGTMQAQAKAARMAASQGQGGGGGGGILSGIGSGISSVGNAVGNVISRAVGGNPEKSAQDRLNAIDKEIASHKAYRRIVLDHRMSNTVNAADTMYRAHHQLSEKVETFNRAFNSTPEGTQWLEDIQKVADARNISTDDVRKRIHAGDQSPDIGNLAQRARAFMTNPDVARSVDEIEVLSRTMRVNAERLNTGLEAAGRNGVPLDDLDGKFADAVSGMKVEDCAFARPGGEPIDGLKERMKEMAEKLVESLRAMIQRFKAALGFGGPSAQGS